MEYLTQDFPLLCIALGLVVLAGVLLVRQPVAPNRDLEAEREQQSRLLTDLSHNLQTPLAVLKGKVEKYERTMLREGHAGSLGQSIDTIAHYINEVLALSNLERTLRNEERKAFVLSDLVREVAEEAAVLAETENIVLVCEVEPDVRMLGNERRLGDALMNLVGNAIKYMGRSSLRHIRISLKTQSGQILLTVTDTGMGIPEAELPHIFERFYRGSARQYGVQGTGLGLAFVERIAKEHGGAITVTSELGKGSSFTLVLPSRLKRSPA